MILHIPHSSQLVPVQYRNQIVLSDGELASELLAMTDAFTDEIFGYPGATVVRFPLSRLIVDVERFPDDADEPMAKVGMGMIYMRTADGKQLRRKLEPSEVKALGEAYERHHDLLAHAVGDELAKHGKALIVDCHSFPSRPLPCDTDQTVPRPDFCIGTDPDHTPPALVSLTRAGLEKSGYGVEVDHPYAGALMPMVFYRTDTRVVTIMIEVNRRLYLDEQTGAKKETSETVRSHLCDLLGAMDQYMLNFTQC